MKTAAIVNPRAGGSKASKKWPAMLRLLESRVGRVEARFTDRRGHAVELARELLAQGFSRLIAVGGDGTINEVANGFFDGDRPIRPNACLGILPVGTGGDFRRMLGIPLKLEAAVEALARGVPVEIDAGRAGFRGHDGATESRVFVNLVSFGMGGEVARRANNFLSPLSGTAAFLWATLHAFLSYRAKRVRIALDGAGEPLTFTITNIAVGNGRYHGGGMQVCPKAVLDDGVFEVSVIERLSLLEAAKDLPVLYSDNIYRHPKVRHFRARRVVAESDEPVHIEIDGEPLGALPLEITLLPRALRVLVPPGSPALRDRA